MAISKNVLYTWIRDSHLYVGLFLGPFVGVFAISVFVLNHPGLLRPGPAAPPRMVEGLRIPPGIDELTGREQVERLKPVMAQLGVAGEIGFVRYSRKNQSVVFSVAVPGRESAVDLNLEQGKAEVTTRSPGFFDAVVFLHKMPGPHLVNIRRNWIWTRIWAWLADATVYLVLFLTASGVYLWAVLRAERAVGLALMGAGAASLMGIIYALCA